MCYIKLDKKKIHKKFSRVPQLLLAGPRENSQLLLCSRRDKSLGEIYILAGFSFFAQKRAVRVYLL